MKVHELRTCPSCESDDAESFAIGEHTLRRCTKCNTVYAPEYADPDEVYVEGYLQGKTPFGLDISHPRFQAFLADVADRRMRMIHQVRRAPGRLLDVGCGSGEVLVAAKAAGWEVAGAEPVEQSAELARARGLNVVPAMLEESGLPEQSFDVVCAFHVLEHIPTAATFLRTLRRWVKPGGLVVIEVPNWRSMQRLHNGHNWSGLRPLEHCVHFTPKTLSVAFKRASLEPVAVRTPTYLFNGQTLDEALFDLSHQEWAKWLAPISSRRTVLDRLTPVPSAPVWGVLWATEAVYRIAKVGGVVFGVARVPAS